MVLPKKYSFSRIFFLLFSLFLSVSLLSCAVHEPGVCIKDGKEYCVNSDWITVIDWDSCFRRGLNCMEGECWEYAIQEFTQAIQFVDEDMRNARPYGMFFRDYFPHREKGICHLYLGETMEALSELQLSLDQAPSSRAKYYLNKARQAYLRETGFDTSPPSIALELEETEYLANKTPFLITGKVQDDQFVASVRVNQAPIFIEMAEPSIPFTLSVDLDEGLNTIQVVAKDLVDREAQESIKVYFDSQGPKVMVNPVQTQQSEGANQVLITAVVYDESGIVSFKLDQKEVQRIGADDICLIEETIEHTPDRESIPFWTEDRSGNITQGSINLLSQRRRRPSLAMRLACSDDGILPIAMGEENSKISIHITYPPRDKFITHEPEIPLQGVIETQHGIRRMEINKQESLGVGAIQDLVERDRQRIIRELSRQKKILTSITSGFRRR